MKIKIFITALLLVVILCITACWEKNPLKKYGFAYVYMPTASPTLSAIDFWLKTKDGKKLGPQFIGDELVVDFPDLDKDGIKEITVTSNTHPTHYAVVKLLLKDGVATGFHIVENHAMCIGFPEEGYMCP